MPKAAKGGRLLLAFLGFAFVLATVPTFFDIYRRSAFDVAPRDDYAPSLLAMVGETVASDRPSLLAKSPFGYRVLSVAAGIPFFHVLPYYRFSNLTETDEPYLRAIAALSMVSYVSILLTGVVLYVIARHVMKRSRGASFLVALMSVGTFQFLSLGGVDPLAVLVVSLLLLVLRRPWLYVPLIVVSAAVNEKIVVIFVVLLLGRLLRSITSRATHFSYWPQLLGTVASAAAYAAMRYLVPLPGNEAQANPTTWLDTLVSTARLSLSLKGFVQNGIPLVVMAILLAVAFAVWRTHRPVPNFSPTDLLVAPALLFTSSVIGAQFGVGRLVMHSFPLYLPLLAFVFDDFLLAGSRDRVEPPASSMTPPRLSRLTKEAVDRTAAAVGLLVASPLLLAIAGGVLVTMGRPILFRQQRPGLHAKPFGLVKFRTMKNGTGPDAERLTRFGEFLRSTSLDELPELWNVLTGGMSFVGPRPLVMWYLPRYTNEQRRRHDVKPGLTGWAQVNGRNALAWEDRFAHDVWYVDHWSLALDARILAKTAWVVLTRRGIHEEGSATMSEFLGSSQAHPTVDGRNRS